MTDSALKIFVAGEKVKASETNSNNQYIISLIQNVGTDLQTYLEQQIDIITAQLTGNVLKPGFIIGLPFSTIPVGYLKCDGSSLLREDYDDLFNAIGTTYGAEDDYHFNLPNYQGAFLRGVGDNAATLGTKQASGVPNITGTITGDSGNSANNISGAFYNDWVNAGGYEGYGDGKPVIRFSASRSSSVYQNGLTEARPVNMSVVWVIKY